MGYRRVTSASALTSTLNRFGSWAGFVIACPSWDLHVFSSGISIAFCFCFNLLFSNYFVALKVILKILAEPILFDFGCQCVFLYEKGGYMKNKFRLAFPLILGLCFYHGA